MTDAVVTPPVVPPADLPFASHPSFATFDAETQGAFKNRGWDQKPVHEVAVQALKSWQEAEKFVGAPKDQLIRLPKDAADEAGWKAVWNRLGVPAEAKDYDFKDVKFADGTELDSGFLDAITPALQKAGVGKDRAPEIVKAVVKFMDGAEATETADRTATLTKERAQWAKDSGANLEANNFVVRQAVVKLGWTPEIVTALENASGYHATMKALLKVGQMMGEDKYVANPGGSGTGVMTGSQAQARLAELNRDASWGAKVLSGNAEAVREFNALTEIIQKAA